MFLQTLALSWVVKGFVKEDFTFVILTSDRSAVWKN